MVIMSFTKDKMNDTGSTLRFIDKIKGVTKSYFRENPR